MNGRAILAAAILSAATVTSLSIAQEQGNQGGQGGGDRGNRQREGGERGERRNFDPAQFRQQMMNRFKEQLKVPDDEWKVIEPKLVKVIDAQRDLRGGGFGGGRRGGGQGGDQQQPTSEIGIAQRDLRTAIENEGTAQEEIDKKLAAYRAAREKAEANLDAARKDLKEVLSPRQEAALVLAGQLE